jgi:transcriptional regulator with XRE-family HTH domain
MMAGKPRSEVSQRVARAIRKSGRTQVEVAAALNRAGDPPGVTPQALSRWLSGARRWNLQRLQEIADVLEIELSELTGAPPPTTVGEADIQFINLVLSGVPAAAAYDLAMRDGSILTPEERQKFNAREEEIREAFRSGRTLPVRADEPAAEHSVLPPEPSPELD